MTVKDLIKKLEELPKDKKIFLGVEGYTTNQDIRLLETENKIYITDSCYYETL